MHVSESVAAQLERSRLELLDLSVRNRLLNMPRHSKQAKTVDVVDERSSEVFRLLVREGKALTFLAGRENDSQHEELEDGFDEQAIVRRRSSHMALSAGKEILDSLPLIIPETITPHRSALQFADRL